MIENIGSSILASDATTMEEFNNLKVGDQMTISLDNKDYKVKIAGIYKLYFRHYMYMSPTYYKKLTNQEIHYNSQYFKLHQSTFLSTL